MIRLTDEQWERIRETALGANRLRCVAGSVDGSPNRLDAMIWGITRLSKIITQIPIA